MRAGELSARPCDVCNGVTDVAGWRGRRFCRGDAVTVGTGEGSFERVQFGDFGFLVLHQCARSPDRLVRPLAGPRKLNNRLGFQVWGADTRRGARRLTVFAVK